MNDGVQQCVATRAGFFGQYCEVPAALQPEVDAFLLALNQLGEASADVASFEAAFAADGLSDTFNSLVSRCTPKAYQMTEQDKAYSKQVARELYEEDKERIHKELLEDITESVYMKAESEANSQRIRAMSEAGVLDDYTRASNAVDNLGRAAGFLGGLFKKKK